MDKFLEFVLFSLLQLQWVYLINDPLSIVMKYLERSFTILELLLVTVFSASFRENTWIGIYLIDVVIETTNSQ